MSRPANEKRTIYSVIDAAREYTRIAMAEHVCVWSESLFEGNWKEKLGDVAPHLFACDFDGHVAWLTLKDMWGGEAGILVETEISFAELRKELRRRLNVFREKENRPVMFRYYDPRVIRAFLPACTPEELELFFGPVTAFFCQSEKPLHVNSYRLDAEFNLLIEEMHIDEFMVQQRYLTHDQIDEGNRLLPEIQNRQKGMTQ